MDKLKLDLITWVTAQNDMELLKKLSEARDDIEFEEKSKSMIIGFRPNNSPVIKSDFLKSIQQAENQIKNGEFLTLENFELEVENW